MSGTATARRGPWRPATGRTAPRGAATKSVSAARASAAVAGQARGPGSPQVPSSPMASRSRRTSASMASSPAARSGGAARPAMGGRRLSRSKFQRPPRRLAVRLEQAARSGGADAREARRRSGAWRCRYELAPLAVVAQPGEGGTRRDHQQRSAPSRTAIGGRRPPERDWRARAGRRGPARCAPSAGDGAVALHRPLALALVVDDRRRVVAPDHAAAASCSSALIVHGSASLPSGTSPSSGHQRRT